MAQQLRALTAFAKDLAFSTHVAASSQPFCNLDSTPYFWPPEPGIQMVHRHTEMGYIHHTLSKELTSI